jgi:hypothetical protein
MILPVLGVLWYAMDDRADMRQRIALLERDQQVMRDERLGKRLIALEVQMQAFSLSVQGLEATLRFVAADRFGR